MTTSDDVVVGTCHFSIGEVVGHKVFGYRGVIFDVDAKFMNSETWYQQMALSKPSKDQPWYHVLVHGKSHITYVAERNLCHILPSTIDHPLIEAIFDSYNGKSYVLKQNVM